MSAPTIMAGMLRRISPRCRRRRSGKFISPATACASCPRAAPCASTITARGRRPNGRRAVPTLLELQHAMRASLVGRHDGAAAMLAEDVPADRLDIHRNTFVTGVTKALRLTYPAVHRLVGGDFFEGAAGVFIA